MKFDIFINLKMNIHITRLFLVAYFTLDKIFGTVIQ